MLHVFLFLAVAFPVFAQDAAVDWFPVHAGDTWIYRHETRDENGGGRAHLDIHRWQTEETVTGAWVVPEGTLVGRQVRVVEGSAGYRVNPEPAVLIRGDCVYSSEVDWKAQEHQLTAAFREELAAGHLAPDFCFPLGKGKTWGAPTTKDWQVAGKKARTFHVVSISSYPGAGVTEEVWFERGVGIVREEEIHRGTIGEIRTWLVKSCGQVGDLPHC